LMAMMLNDDHVFLGHAPAEPCLWCRLHLSC